MKTHFRQKVVSIITSFTLLVQTLNPFILALPAYAATPDLSLTFDEGANRFGLVVDTKETVDYLLAYRISDKTEVVTGSGKADSGDRFAKEIFAGTCSENGACSPHKVLRGIAKVEASAIDWGRKKEFTIENGQLNISQEQNVSSIDLLPEEELWLESGVNVSPTETPTPTPIPVPSALQADMKECLAEGTVLIDSQVSDWMVDQELGRAETISPVSLGVRYLFPLEAKVSVSFRCLPKDPSLRARLAIQKINVSDLNLPESVGLTDGYAYDITTGMKDGSFEYDVTLPKQNDKEAEVSFIEKSAQEAKSQPIEESEVKSVGDESVNQAGDQVEVMGLDHFTIFIATYSDISFSVEKTRYQREETVFAKSGGLDSQHYYRIKIDPPSEGAFSIGSCSRPNASHELTASYPLPSGAAIGTNWKVKIYDYGHSDSDCSNSGNKKAEKSFEVYRIVCGNGKIESGEQCDDDDTSNGDGCSSSCQIESGWACSDEPSGCRVNNPPLPPNSCGLDVSLVIDNSNSISESEMTQMKNAMIGFVDALSGTPTEFSVVRFGDSASVLRPFTTDYNAVRSAINGLHHESEATNWIEALKKARGTFDPRTNPNLIIMATDGNPTAPTFPYNITNGIDLTGAITEANTTKLSGIRIMALGIGNDLDQDNLKDISGPSVGSTVNDDVVITDFGNLATQLADFAKQSCGGTITVKKLVDSDGDLQTSDDQTPAGGWTFDIGGVSKTTQSSDGRTDAVNLGAGIFSVTETVEDGYDLLDASCSGATNNGTRNDNSVDGVQLAESDIVSCTFVNSQVPQTGTISIDKVTSPTGDSQSFDFEIKQGDQSVDQFSLKDADPAHIATLSAGVYSLSEVIPDFWSQTMSSCLKNGTEDVSPSEIVLAPGDEVVCTFNNQKLGSVIAHKFIDDDMDGIQDSTEASKSGWQMTLYFSPDCPSDATKVVKTTDAYGNAVFDGLAPLSYSVQESTAEGWLETTPVCQNITLGQAGNETVNFGNFEKGSAQGCKYEDLDADGVRDNETESQIRDWTINLYNSDWQKVGDALTGQPDSTDNRYYFHNLTKGVYYLCEGKENGWEQTGPVLGSTNLDAVPNLSSNQSAEGPVCWRAEITASGQSILSRQFGNRELGKITVSKNIDWDESGQLGDNPNDVFGATDWNWNIDSEGGYQTGTTQELSPGTYEISEVVKSGYHVVNLTCGRVNFGAVSSQQITISQGEELTCTFTNAIDKSSLTLKKLTNPTGLAGQFSFALAGSKNDFVALSDGESHTFSGLLPGSYTLTETLSDGWTVSAICDDKPFVNGEQLTISPGREIKCEFTNSSMAPELTIQKNNNRYPTVQLPGGDVVYTLVVTALKNQVLDTKVVDLPPGGFTYRKGTWTAISSLRGDLKVLGIMIEPVYSSPGLWNLGDLQPGEVVTLTYIADIADSQYSGLYRDLAWARGKSASADLVLANQNSGVFVGTEVEVDRNNQSSTDVDVVKEEGAVLGATTETLPATGARTILLILAALLLTLGSILVASSPVLRSKLKALRRLVKIFAITLIPLMFLSRGNVYAADLMVRIEQPESPTNQNSFTIDTVALDIQNRPITIKCYKKAPGEAIFTQFGSDINLKEGGNSSQCQTSSSIIITKGSYQFYVEAIADAEKATSQIVGVDYDNDAPSTPGSFSKEKMGSCQYKISFKTGDDNGRTSKVEVYRSDKEEFTADDNTRVGIVWIGSNQEGSFTDTVPDCGKTYYYAIRAFSGVGNGSGITGDQVTVKGATTTITPSQGAIAAGGSSVGKPLVAEEKSKEGVIGGGTSVEITGTEEKKESDKGVLGAVTEKLNLKKIVGFGAVGLGILLFVYYAFFSQKKNSPKRR